jgi:hypothetical protein
MASPALAAVTITCEQPDPNIPEIIISFDNDGDPCVRAFALDITVSDGNITDVNCTNSEYYIYPGSISIDSGGSVSDWGSCLCSAGDHPDTLGGLDTNGVTVEMGSLYEGDAAPSQSGELLRITIDTTCTVSIDENASEAAS